jgi:hypothetical protein
MAPESAQIYVTVAARLIFRAMPWVVERPGAHCDLDGGSSNYGNFIGFDPSPYIYIYIGYMYIYMYMYIYICVCGYVLYTPVFVCVSVCVHFFFGLNMYILYHITCQGVTVRAHVSFIWIVGNCWVNHHSSPCLNVGITTFFIV